MCVCKLARVHARVCVQAEHEHTHCSVIIQVATSLATYRFGACISTVCLVCVHVLV